MTFGEIINKIRTEKGMTQDELAQAVGYKSRSSIAKIEKGERDASQTMIAKLAKALGTTPSELMGFEKEKSTPIPKNRSAIIQQIAAMPDDRFEEMAAKLEFAGYIEPEDQ